MAHGITVKQAETEYEEVLSWTCKTCDTMVETDGDYCRSCASYWQDIAEGFFDD